jgi:hypothetical protein
VWQKVAEALDGKVKVAKIDGTNAQGW